MITLRRSRMMGGGLLLALLAVFGPGASAQVPVDHRKTFEPASLAPVWRGSGSTVEMRANETYRYLQKIEWWEHNNRPCKVRATFVHVNQLTKQSQTWEHRDCKSPGAKKTFKAATYPIQLGSSMFTKLKVCVNNNRVKGLRGEGVDLSRAVMVRNKSSGDRLTIRGPRVEYKRIRRPNCGANGWQPSFSECALQEVVTGFRLYHDDGAWTGLRVYCARLRKK